MRNSKLQIPNPKKLSTSKFEGVPRAERERELLAIQGGRIADRRLARSRFDQLGEQA